jgi:hypothetical protein
MQLPLHDKCTDTDAVSTLVLSDWQANIDLLPVMSFLGPDNIAMLVK